MMRNKILILDDNEPIADLAKCLINARYKGTYDVVTKNSVEDARRYFTKNAGEILGGLIDLDINGESGSNFASNCKSLDSELKIIIMTGSDERYVLPNDASNIACFLYKPFKAEKLYSAFEKHFIQNNS